MSHSKDWHDKDLEYVAFKHKQELSALVSPKIKGMERKGRNDIDDNSFEFDPNADLSKMSQDAREKWYAEYQKAGKSSDLHTDANGKKVIL